MSKVRIGAGCVLTHICNDQAVLAPLGELYALTHTIQRIDTHAPRGSREPLRNDSCLESGPRKVTCAG